MIEPQTAREIGMTYDHIRVTPLATHVGAEISGVDLAAQPGGPGLAEIRRALGEYGVVFFRDRRSSKSPLRALLAESTSTASLRLCRATR